MTNMREAAGYIVFSSEGAEPRYLLLRNARHQTWGFPKGHLEPGEDVRTAARRELFEETGITEFEEVPNFHVLLEYDVPPEPRSPSMRHVAARKRVTFFLARVRSPWWVRSEEHDVGEWTIAAEVRSKLHFPDSIRAFDLAVAEVSEIEDR